MKLLYLGCLALLAAVEPTFTDNTKIDFRHEASPTSQKYLIETMGGGVALLDYDNDGLLDIFFVNGAALADPMPKGKGPDKSAKKYWNRLYQQQRDGAFRDVSEKAGLTGAAQNFYGMGVAAGDFDNDGFTDLYVTGYGGNTLYRNTGKGTFEDVTAKSGTGAGGWSSSAGFFDFDNDGKLDLFVARYVEWSFESNRYCGDVRPGGRAYCHPDNFAPLGNLLYRNNGDGTFTDVSERSGIGKALGKALGVSFADYDSDGWMDIYVANDSVQCFLFHNNGNGTFSEVSLTAGTGFNEDGKTFAGMGTDFADYDNDGHADIIVTDLSDERYVLFHNNGDGSFTDITTQSGIGRATSDYSGWSTRFLDYDNDGWKDLFVAQGHVMDTIAMTNPNRQYMQPPLLLRNRAGEFARVKLGGALEKSWAGRGAAFGDLDNDGDIDIVVANVNQPAYVLRNDAGSAQNWIGFELKGTKSNRDGIGTSLKVTGESGLVQHYTVETAVGYQSASDKRVCVGMGANKMARSVEIRWPSGVVQKMENIKTRQWLKVTEPAR